MLSEIKIELNELKHFNEFYSNNINYVNDLIRILSQENTQSSSFYEKNEVRDSKNHLLKLIGDLRSIETKTNRNYKIMLDEVLNKLCIIRDKLTRYKSDLIKNIKSINNDLYNEIDNYNNLIKLMSKYQKCLDASVIKLLNILSQESKQKELLTEKINLVKNRVIRLGDIGKENNLYDTILQEQQIFSEQIINTNGGIIRSINNYYENNVKANINNISNSIADIIDVRKKRNSNSYNNGGSDSTYYSNNSNTRSRNTNGINTNYYNNNNGKINQQVQIFDIRDKDDDEMRIYEIIDKSIRDNKLLNDYFFPIYYYPNNINNNNIKEQYDNINNINKILEYENLNLRQQEIKYKCKILSKLLLNKNFSNFDNYNKYINLLYKYDTIRREMLVKLEEYRRGTVGMVLDFRNKSQILDRMYKGLIYSVVRYYYTKHIEYYQIYIEHFDNNNNKNNGNNNNNHYYKENDIKDYMIQVVNGYGNSKIVKRTNNNNENNSNTSNINNNKNSRSNIDYIKNGETDKLGITYYVDEQHRYLVNTSKLNSLVNKIIFNGNNKNNSSRENGYNINNNNNLEIKYVINTYLTGVLSGIVSVFNMIVGILIEFSDYDFNNINGNKHNYDSNNNNKDITCYSNNSNTSSNGNINDISKDNSVISDSKNNDIDSVAEVNSIDALMGKLRDCEIVFDTDSVYFLCLVYGMSRWVCCTNKIFDFESSSNTNNSDSSNSDDFDGINGNNNNKDITYYSNNRENKDKQLVYVLLHSDKYLYSSNPVDDYKNDNTNNNKNKNKSNTGRTSATNNNNTNNNNKLVNVEYKWIKNSEVMNMKNYVYYKLNLKDEIIFKTRCSLIDKIYLNGVMLISKDQICFYSYFNSITLFGKSTYLTIDRSEVIYIKYNGKEISNYKNTNRENGDNINSNNNSNINFENINGNKHNYDSSNNNKDITYYSNNSNTSSNGNINDIYYNTRNSNIIIRNLSNNNDKRSIYSDNNSNDGYDNMSMKSYTTYNSITSGNNPRNRKSSDRKTMTNRLEVMVSRGNVYMFSILYSLSEEVLRFLSDFAGNIDIGEYNNSSNTNYRSNNINDNKDNNNIRSNGGETDNTNNSSINNNNTNNKDNNNIKRKDEEQDNEREKELNRIIDNVNKYVSNNNSNGKDNIEDQIYNIKSNTLISTNNYNISVDKIFNILFNDMNFEEKVLGEGILSNKDNYSVNRENGYNINGNKIIKRGSKELKANKERKNKGHKDKNNKEKKKDNNEQENSSIEERRINEENMEDNSNGGSDITNSNRENKDKNNKEKISLIKNSKILLGSSNFSPNNQYIYNYSSMMGKCNENIIEDKEKDEEVIIINEDVYNSSNNSNSNDYIKNNGTKCNINTNSNNNNVNNSKINAILVKNNLKHTISDKRILYNNNISEHIQYVFLKDTVIYQSVSHVENMPYNKCFFTLYTIVISGNNTNDNSINYCKSNSNASINRSDSSNNDANKSNTGRTSATSNNTNNINNNKNSSRISSSRSNSKITFGGKYNVNMFNGYGNKGSKVGMSGGRSNVEVTSVTIYSEIVFRKKILLNKIVRTEGMNKIMYVTRVINNHLSKYSTTIVNSTSVTNNKVENVDSMNKFMLVVVFIIIVMYKVFY